MKNTIFTRIFALVVVALLAISLSACGTEKPTPTEKFTVIFDVNAGDDIVQNEPDTARVDSGSAVSKPSPDPIRSGYDFLGWFDNADGNGSVYNFNSPVTKNNFVLYAKWGITITYHSVTLNFQDGNPNMNSQIANGLVFTEPTAPTRNGYRFDGWFIDSAFSSQYNFSTPITEDVILYAKWIQVFTVTFNFNYEGSPVSLTVLVDNQESAEEPALPSREDFTFAGWFTDIDLTLPYEFEAVNQNITIYAKWIENSTTQSYTVEFDYNYVGSPSKVTQTILEGAVFTPLNTTRTDYRFLGWYLDNGTFQQRFSSSTPVTSNMVLYANWVRVYQLSIDYNYSGAINPSAQVVDENAPITAPQSPSRIGYTFAGWSDSSNGLIGYDLTTGITQNKTIYAQWSKVNVFEAEFLNFNDFSGWGFSGNATGTDAIVQDTTGMGQASNDRFVTYLYGKGITLTYSINSDRNVNNVILTLRLSAEIKDIFIQSSKTAGVLDQEPVYTIKVNGQTITYPKIEFIGVPSQSSNMLYPFQDYLISMNIQLQAGINTIQLITDNELGMGGTMSATAPMVDCLKLTTYAVLTWTPKLDNY